MNMLARLRQLLTRTDAGAADRVISTPPPSYSDADGPERDAEFDAVLEGTWSTEWRKGKLRVFGSFHAPQHALVTLRIGPDITKLVPAAATPDRGYLFTFAFGKSTLVHFPNPAELSVEVDGRPLLHQGAEQTVTVEIPKGDGTLRKRLDDGYIIDKWGQLKLPISLKPEWAERTLALYEAFSDYFESRFERRPFFIAGSLLGLIRENSFLPFDDDMDIGYFSPLTEPEAVRDEMFEMLIAMAKDGQRVRVGHNGGFYKVGTAEASFDVFPSWHYGDRIWMPQSQSMPSDPTLLHPPKPVEFLGARVFIPNRPEDYLALHYGENWRVPDPHYVERKAPGVLKVLSRARLTDEQRRVISNMRQE